MSAAEAILVVDDDQDTRNLLGKSLRGFHRPIVLCASGAEALRWLNGHAACVIISDLCMPGMDGVAFLKLAKSGAPSAKRLLVTGSRGFCLSLNALRDGLIDLFLAKPFEITMLREAVARLLGQEVRS